MLRYLGMSFITGAVAHGFFSGFRSLSTFAIGIGIFILALYLERDQARVTATQLSWSALLATGIGVFTGGIQHFPDSPERSLLIVPLGFILSVYAYAHSEQHSYTQQEKYLIFALSLAIVLLSFGAFVFFEHATISPHTH